MTRCKYVHEPSGERCRMTVKPVHKDAKDAHGRPRKARDGSAHRGPHRIRAYGTVIKIPQDVKA